MPNQSNLTTGGQRFWAEFPKEQEEKGNGYQAVRLVEVRQTTSWGGSVMKTQSLRGEIEVCLDNSSMMGPIKWILNSGLPSSLNRAT